MRTRLVHIGFAAIAALSLVACGDQQRDPVSPLSPKAGPDNLIIVLNPADFVEIAAGSSYTCARQRVGNVYCWGMYAAAPSLMFQGATHIAVGDAHACALNSAGAAFCWGLDTQGQVGWETAYDQAFEPVEAVAGPVDKNNPYGPLLPPLTFSSIAAGGNSTCGTTSQGVFCWGDLGAFPQITSPGTGVPSLITNPNGFPYAGFSSLAVGKNHACGFVSGQVDCWGLNSLLQTGVDPSQTFAFVPNPNGTPSNVVIFAMGNQLGSSVARVSAQGALTCADMLNKTVECFGNNDNAELGNGVGPNTFVPQLVGGGMQLHGVSAGAQHACAIDANSLAECWGSDSRGQLGNGQALGTFTTVQKVAVVSIDIVHQVFGASPMTFRALAAGAEHTCGIGTDNHIYCWGDNKARQLGRDVFTQSGATASFTVNPVQTM
jgi:alpha-tubulin suppressor-like RCC1 family protein